MFDGSSRETRRHKPSFEVHIKCLKPGMQQRVEWPGKVPAALSVFLAVSVLVRVMFSGFGSVVLGLHVMAVSYVAVVASSFVVACIVMLSGRTMVFGGLFMMIGGLHMMISACFRHRILSDGECVAGEIIQPA